jgi:hypothetical protein
MTLRPVLVSLVFALAACGGSNTSSNGSSTTPSDEHRCSQPLHWNGHACVRTLNNGPNLGRICPPGQHREDGGCIDNGQTNDD